MPTREQMKTEVAQAVMRERRRCAEIANEAVKIENDLWKKDFGASEITKLAGERSRTANRILALILLEELSEC